MVFNEILIPQDSFMETNVTRKRSVVGNSHSSQTNLILLFHKTILKEIKLLLLLKRKLSLTKLNKMTNYLKLNERRKKKHLALSMWILKFDS